MHKTDLTIKTTKGNLLETITSQYVQRGGWCPAMPSSVTSVTTLGSATHTRLKTFEYDNKGNLTKETSDPSHTNKLVTEYKNLNDFGAPRTIQASANEMPSKS